MKNIFAYYLNHSVQVHEDQCNVSVSSRHCNNVKITVFDVSKCRLLMG